MRLRLRARRRSRRRRRRSSTSDTSQRRTGTGRIDAARARSGFAIFRRVPRWPAPRRRRQAIQALLERRAVCQGDLAYLLANRRATSALRAAVRGAGAARGWGVRSALHDAPQPTTYRVCNRCQCADTGSRINACRSPTSPLVIRNLQRIPLDSRPRAPLFHSPGAPCPLRQSRRRPPRSPDVRQLRVQLQLFLRQVPPPTSRATMEPRPEKPTPEGGLGPPARSRGSRATLGLSSRAIRNRCASSPRAMDRPRGRHRSPNTNAPG